MCINCDGGTVLGFPPWITNAMNATILSLEDAKRIVACVNACAGIDTTVLQNNHFEYVRAIERRLPKETKDIPGLLAIVAVIRNKTG